MPEHFRDIDQYLATFPPDVQAVLQQIRQEIHRAVPGSSEVISYNIPTMTRGGHRYVHFAGWKAHVSLYPTPEADPDLARELAPYEVGKGTLKFSLKKPIPYELIGRVAAALAERS